MGRKAESQGRKVEIATDQVLVFRKAVLRLKRGLVEVALAASIQLDDVAWLKCVPVEIGVLCLGGL